MWTLNDIPLPLLKGNSVTLTQRSQAASELLVSIAGPFDAPPIADDQWCVLKRAGVAVFAGPSVPAQGEASGRGEVCNLRILDAWADLDVSYRSGSDTRLRFGEDGTPTSLAAAVTLVVNRMIALGARLTLGTVDLDGEFPSMEFDNQTGASILQALLRWSPGAMTHLTYGDPAQPTVHFVKAAGAPQLAMSVERKSLVGLSPQTDLRLPGVRLVFRKKLVTNFGEAEALRLQTAGDADHLRTPAFTMDLQPATCQWTLQKARVEVAALNVESMAWWQNFGVTAGGEIVTVFPSGDAALTHYLTAGEMPGWMLSEIDGAANGDPHGCNGPINNPDAVFTPPTVGQVFGGEPAAHINNNESFKLGKRKFSVLVQYGLIQQVWELTLTCTNCNASGTYYRQTNANYQPGEAEPGGLAAAFFAGASKLAHSGRVTIPGQECDPATHRPGKRITLTDTAWTGIDAPIHVATHDLMTGQSTLTFGALGFLSVSDYLELSRAARNRRFHVRPAPAEEEESAAIHYQAAQPTSSPGQPPDTEEDTGSVTIRFLNEEGDQDGTIGGGVVVAGKSAGNNGGAATLTEIAPGTYDVVFLPIMGRITPGTVQVTVVAGETATQSGTYIYIEEIKLVDSGDSGNSILLKTKGDKVLIQAKKGEKEFNFDADDITGDAPVKIRPEEYCEGDETKTIDIVAGEPE